MPTERLSYTVAEASEMTGLSKARIYELCRQDLFPHVRVGERQVIVPRHALDVWLNGGHNHADGGRIRDTESLRH